MVQKSPGSNSGGGNMAAMEFQIRKYVYFGHVTRKDGECSEKEIIQGTTSWVKRTWQTKDDLAQQHHVTDRTWNGRTASEYQQQEGVASARSQYDQPSERRWLKKKKIL